MDVSKAVFSLDKLSKAEQLPVTVEVIGGVHTGGGNIQVCRGDVLQVLELNNIAKVTAEFTDDITIANRIFKPDSFQLTIPLNYTGKLSIVNEIKSYQLVSEIFEDMPRFVRIKEKLVVPDGRALVELEAGSVIEVVCRQHGKQRGHRREVDTLRIRCENLGYDYEMDVPVNTRGSFRSDPDTVIYTVRNAIERSFLPHLCSAHIGYPLPAVAAFQDDLLYSLFAEKFPHDIKKGFSAPETVRLLKTVTHEAYVSRLEQRNNQQPPADPSSDVLLLNASNPEVRNIRVRVLDPETAPRPDYEIPVMKQATLEKALRRPELVQLSDADDDYPEVFPEDKIKQGIQQESHANKPRSTQRAISLHEPSADPGEYVDIKKSSSTSEIDPDTATARSNNQKWSISGLTSKFMDKIREPHHQKQVGPAKEFQEDEKIHTQTKGLIKSDSSVHASEKKEPTKMRVKRHIPDPHAKARDAGKEERPYSTFPSQEPTEDIGIYVEISELDMDDVNETALKTNSDQDWTAAVDKTKPNPMPMPKPKIYKPIPQPTNKPNSRPTAGLIEERDSTDNVFHVDDLKGDTSEDPNGVGTAGVRKQSKINQRPLGEQSRDFNVKSDTATVVEFQNLSVDELCARFITCGLKKLTSAARLHSLDGRWFSKIDEVELRGDPFNLSSIEMKKFLKVKDGWIPKF